MRKGLFAVSAVILMSVLAFSGCGIKSNKNETAVRTAVDAYFKATNDMDLDEIYILRGPNEEKADDVRMIDYYKMLYPPNALFEDWRQFGPDDYYYALMGDYGYSGDRDEIEEEFKHDKETDTIIGTKLIPRVDYEIEVIKDATKCKVSYREGLSSIDVNKKNEINKKFGVDPDEVYYVKANYKYYYNDMLYGYNPEWWEINDFSQSYEDTIKKYEDLYKNIFVYSYQGNWYVYDMLYSDVEY